MTSAMPHRAAAAEAILAALRGRRSIAERIMIAVAHPDDETIGLGAQLCRFENVLLVHATDGAPRDGEDMARYGFGRAEDYAAARRAELAHALEAGGASSARTMTFDIPDKEAFRDLAGLTRRLHELLQRETPAALFTHAYEGGHPDHDAVAFAAHAACRLRAHDQMPAIIEMALYHRGDGEVVRGDFLANEATTVAIPLDEGDVGRKRRMIDCFTTQRWLLMEFPLDCERLRFAPAYDFRAPPHRGVLHYETLGWGITGAEWQGRAAEALAQLGLAEPPCL